jgi:small-conductance mechanosensitive channel
MVTVEEIFDWEIPFLNSTVLEILIAVVVTIIIAIVMLSLVLRIVRRMLEKSPIPPLLTELMVRLIRILLMVVVLLVFLSLIGFDVSSIVLALAAVMGLILAFGMSDSTNNFFAGVWIATIRPFHKEDVVEVAGFKGKVIAVGIMATELRTPDNVQIIIPNRNVWGEPIANYTRLPRRRVDTDVGIGYGSDVGKAYDLAMKLMKEHPKILEDPAPSIFMTALADSSVNIQLRPWAKTGDYWDVLHDLRIALHDELPKAGIDIPFPQLEVHMASSGSSPPPGM